MTFIFIKSFPCVQLRPSVFQANDVQSNANLQTYFQVRNQRQNNWSAFGVPFKYQTAWPALHCRETSVAPRVGSVHTLMPVRGETKTIMPNFHSLIIKTLNAPQKWWQLQKKKVKKAKGMKVHEVYTIEIHHIMTSSPELKCWVLWCSLLLGV